MYTVDTSVWVNGSDTLEAGHEISRACFQLLAQRGHQLMFPTLVLPEIAGAISRTRSDAALARHSPPARSRKSAYVFTPRPLTTP
jgi:predicted nucleic acid-binding protein